MKIAVVGAGALGLFYGALLQKSGNDVRFLLRRDYDAISRKGLFVTSPMGDFNLSEVAGYRTPEQMGTTDLVIVGLKTFSNDALVATIRPLMQANNAILTLQNGLGNEELLAEAFGPERVLGGVAFLCSNRGEPGTVHHLGQGGVRLGEYSGGLSKRAEKLAALFRDTGIDCEAVADLKKARWEKLVWNIPFNGLCALTGKTVTEILMHPPSRAVARRIMEEVVTGGNLQGLSVPIDAETFIPRMFALTEPMTGYRPSMMIDRIEGRPLELEAIYGIPLRNALDKGFDMTHTRMLHALLELGEPSA